MSLPDAGGPLKNDVAAFVEETPGGQFFDQRAVNRGLKAEVKIAESLGPGQAGEVQAGLDDALAPGGDLGFQEPAQEARVGPATPPGPALWRHGPQRRQPRPICAARKRPHARPLRPPMGQIRLREHGHHKNRSPRPRHDGRPSGFPRNLLPTRQPRRPRPPAKGRSCNLQNDARSRHHRRFPNRESGPDVNLAPHEAG